MNTRALFSPATNAMSQVRSEVERMFENVFTSDVRSDPSLNMIDADTTIVVEAELPGVKMEDLEVTVADGKLTISGRREVSVPNGATALRRERGAIEFERTITIPAQVESDGTSAVLKNGVLTLTLSKTAKALSRRIEVIEG